MDGDHPMCVEDREETILRRVDVLKDGWYSGQYDEGDKHVQEYIIEQVKMEKGIVYTGHYCC